MGERIRRCLQCKGYKPSGLQTPVGYFCGYDHAQSYAMARVAKKRAKDSSAEKKQLRAEKRERKEKLRDRKWYLKKAQAVFNAWIRKRDHDQPCISCQRYHTGQYHAGHYRTTKAAPHLRFNEQNCSKQCSVCNHKLSGNIGGYRKGLIAKIGLESVEAIENNNAIKTWTMEELKGVIDHYGGLK